MTRRTEHGRQGRGKGRRAEKAERGAACARRKLPPETRGTTLGQKFADADALDRRRRRKTLKEAGKSEEQKGFPKAPLRSTGVLCKRDIKISLQIASTTFPFCSRSAYRIEARETDCSLCSVSLRRLLCCPCRRRFSVSSVLCLCVP